MSEPTCAQIRDGHTFPFVMPGRGPYPPIKGVYRPASSEAGMDYQDAERSGGKKRMAGAIKLLMSGGPDPVIRSWDMKDDKGEPEPFCEAAIRRIPLPQLERLISIVTLYAADEWETDAKN